MSESTEAKVKRVIVQQLGVEESKVTLDSNLIHDLRADSLDVVELVMALEEEFDVQIPDEASEEIKTIRDIVKYIEGRTNA